MSLCQCGCGESAPIAKRTDRARGYIRNQPVRFIPGHNNHSRRVGHSVEDRGYITPCWIWTGSLNERGYGRAWGGQAHRASYEREYGPIEPGLELDHLCRVRACLNPAHLEPVTHAENMRRSALALTVPADAGTPAFVRDRRIAAGLSQSGLARLLACSQSLVSLWECGGCVPNAQQLETLMRVAPDGQYEEPRRRAA